MELKKADPLTKSKLYYTVHLFIKKDLTIFYQTNQDRWSNKSYIPQDMTYWSWGLSLITFFLCLLHISTSYFNQKLKLYGYKLQKQDMSSMSSVSATAVAALLVCVLCVYRELKRTSKKSTSNKSTSKGQTQSWHWNIFFDTFWFCIV